MINKTYIKGKDRDLESSIQTMQETLKSFGFNIKKVSSLNPAPHAFSVHIQDSESEFMFTNGKGACEKSSFASSLGEFFERLCTNYFFADYYLGEEFSNAKFVHFPDERWFDEDSSDELLNEELWNFYDPEDELSLENIYELNSGAGERGVCALPFVSEKDSKVTYFPVNIINNLYVSNGMSAGNTRSEARVQALSEILERYVKNKIISEGLCLPEIPRDVLENFSQIQEVIKKLEAHGYHLRVADASLGGVFPVISVTLINPKDGSVFASFGSHPSFEVALERTVTELLQGRDLNNFNDFKAPSFDLDEVSDQYNLEEHFINSSGLVSYEFFKKESDYDFVHWDHDSNTKDEYTYLSDLIFEMGLDIYIADYEYMGVYTCRIIVPGMSEIYPVSDLLWSNNNSGALFRKELLSLHDLSHDECHELLENLTDSDLDDNAKVSDLIGIITDEGTLWSTIRLAEIKAMLCLATKDYEGAIEFNEVTLLSEQDEKRVSFYRSLQAILKIHTDEEKELYEYKDSLVLMYTAQNVQTCLDLIEGKERFYGLTSPGLSLKGLNKHKKLLDGYSKLHKAKEIYYGK